METIPALVALIDIELMPVCGRAHDMIMPAALLTNSIVVNLLTSIAINDTTDCVQDDKNYNGGDGNFGLLHGFCPFWFNGFSFPCCDYIIARGKGFVNPFPQFFSASSRT